MEKNQSAGGDISSAEAVLLGALAPGVNVRSISFSKILLLFYIYLHICSHVYEVLIQGLVFLLFGFQGPTWNTLKSTFLMLGLCLAVMLGLAFSSSDSSLILHVAFLVLITITLFLLLNWYYFLILC